MFRRHKRRHTNIVFVIFRLVLSLVIFAALLGGIFSAYKHFSGTNPLNLSPKAITNTFVGLLSQQKLFQKVLGQFQEFQEVKGTANTDFKKTESKKISSKLIFRFGIFADSHSDNIHLKRALDQIKKDYGEIRFIIGLGDYSEVGTLDELSKAKVELDNAGFRYFLAPGDHDLWDSRNNSQTPTANYNQAFGPAYQSFVHENYLFLILYNSDNYVGLGGDQKNWLSNELNVNKNISGSFVFLHEPLFHPSSDHFMGRVEEGLKSEAQTLAKQFAQAGVKRVFAADTHFFSEYSDPQTNLPMVTVGAITSERNLQLPRFAIVSVFEDGSSKVEDVEIK